jgi:RHS repeat-associated protein
MVNTTTAVNTDTAPDGTHTAATLTPGSGQAYVDDYIANPSLYDQQTVTASVYLRTTGSNSMSTVLAIGQESGSLWSAVAQNTITVTPQWQRFEVTGQTLNGLMQLYMQIGTGGFTSGATLEMWGAQFVVGLSAGPYSPTAGDTTTVIATGQQGTLVPTGLNEAYAYDSFGNILQNGPSNAFYTANNQMFGYAYDAAGNLLSNGVTPLTWDAESRLTSAAGATYIYDAMGNRVEKQGVGVTDTIYFGGRPIARFSAGQWTDLIYGPNGLLAEVAGTQTAQPTYRLLDHLGTEVGQTDASAQLINPLDYRPFGGVFSGNTNDPYLFTGKERDAESGLDNFGARYFGSSMGRFMSPDFGGPAGLSHPDPVPWADLENPQTLNLYSYGNNNPVSNADDDGHDVNICDNNGNCHQVSNEEYQKAQQGNNGGLNVPTLDQVGSNGNGSGQFNATAITDSNGNTVGTATYVSNGNLDYYANANGYQQLSAASTVVKGATVGVAVTFGAVGVGMVAADIALGSELTTLGDIGTTPTSGQLSQAEQVLQQSGKKGVEKAIRTLEKRVAQHLEKLDQFQRTGGYTSKTTSEIQNFQSLIRAYQSVLK